MLSGKLQTSTRLQLNMTKLANRMKTFTLRFVPHSESMSKRLLFAAKSGKPDVHPHELQCSSYSDLLEIATESRLEILRSIISKKPKSLYELAKLVKRDQSYVLKVWS